MARDLEALLEALDLDEKCALLAGAGLWSTVAVPRAGIPAVQLSDGPNGARGATLPGTGGDDAEGSVCAPCGSALGATWDTELVERVGALLGVEARRKSCRVLLAPTVNLHRSPLGGRTFESYGEDPLHVGRLAAAFVRGVQSQGVACTVKHFAGNECETDRFVVSSEIDERTLREVHLLPFELAVREGGALGIMTAYNRLNGEHCSDSVWLLDEVLRGEWGFDGFVVTDWFALADTAASIRAGLDLEMPGPGRAYGPALAAAVRDGRVDVALVDAAVRRLLRVFDHLGALDEQPAPTRSVDLPEDRALVREAARDAMVLLRNERVLPLDVTALRTIALIGPNAARAVIMGGGSSSLPARYRRSPLDALRDRLGDRVDVQHEAGVDIGLVTPEIPQSWLRTPDGAPGVHVRVHRGSLEGDVDGDIAAEATMPSSALVWFGTAPLDVEGEGVLRATTVVTPDAAGRMVLSLVQAGPSQVRVDGELVLDGTAGPLRPGGEYAGLVSRELTCELDLAPERPVTIELRSTLGSGLVRGAKLGLRAAAPLDGIERAVALAAKADATIVVVGTDDHWEGEGGDRATMALPGRQDELVARVLEVAPDAVVVCNAGSPVTMPWRDEARAILQIWFGGQEMADALVDVLTGDAEPGGRLPTTFPVAIEHTPAYGSFPATEGRVRYVEGVLAGHRWYDTRRLPVAFPFGHGLSYTSFAIGPPVVSGGCGPGDGVEVRVPVTNRGDRTGKEVVQLYVAAPAGGLAHRPQQELKAFAAVHLAPGETREVVLSLDARSFARWSDPEPGIGAELRRVVRAVPWAPPPREVAPRGWFVDAGTYELRVGRSSADIAHVVPFEVPRSFAL